MAAYPRKLFGVWFFTEALQTPRCARMPHSVESLFVVVTEPEIPATTNADERSLRHLVVSRKISGGTRSPRRTALCGANSVQNEPKGADGTFI